MERLTVSETKKRKKTPRAVRPGDIAKKDVCWPHFERIDSRRMRLKSDFSRTYYALCCLIAEEFDAQRTVMTASGAEPSNEVYGNMLFLKHASSTLRMVAERVLKSFRLDDVIRAARYSHEEWGAAVTRLNRRGELALPRSPEADSVPVTS